MTRVKSLIIGCLVFSSISLGSFQISAQQPTETESSYQRESSQVNTQLSQIDQTLQTMIANYSQNAEQKSTLSAQISEKRNQIRETDRLITDTRLVIAQLEKQIQDLDTEINTLNDEISRMYIELQHGYDPLKIIITGNNIGDILSKFFISSSITDQIQLKRNDQVVKQSQLEETRQQNLKVKDQLEQARNLLNGEASNLDALIRETNGQESRYQELLNSISQQKIELEASLNTLSGEYLAELVELRNDNQDFDYTSSTNCRFEEKNQLNVAPNYFGKPANGVLTQKYHCNHDGVDIAAGMGADLYAIADGVVERVGPRMDGCIGLGCNGGFGNYILLKHTLPDGDRVYSLYAHLRSQPTLTVGTNVNKGQVVGFMGCTGFTKPYPCGVHVHFVMLSSSYEQHGLGCRLGKSKCYNPSLYIQGI
jgi:murein DD-endopeptidase MepM/ murein hydrolase activator NlpD